MNDARGRFGSLVLNDRETSIHRGARLRGSTPPPVPQLDEPKPERPINGTRVQHDEADE